jgi:hypothetical protein
MADQLSKIQANLGVSPQLQRLPTTPDGYLGNQARSGFRMFSYSAKIGSHKLVVAKRAPGNFAALIATT